jgi:hypothetical protein
VTSKKLLPITNNIEIIFYGLFLLLFPFYFFPSGNPQIADIIIILIFFIALLSLLINKFKLVIKINKIIKLFFFFILYVFFVNIIWFLILNQYSLLIYTSYYFYNFIVFILFIWLYRRYKGFFLNIAYRAICYSIIIQSFLSFFIINWNYFRQTLFFNNPNQLGYYSLLSLTIFWVGKNIFKTTKLFSLLTLFSGIYLLSISLSSAAILGGIILFIIVFLKYKFNVLPIILVLLISTSFFYFYQTNLFPLETILANLEKRITTIGQSPDDSLAGRGYNRIINHPYYLIFGAGEGEFSRFKDQITGEIHSGITTILFSYGIIGLTILFFFFWNCFKFVGLKYFVFLFPAFFYGLSHQNFRFSPLWVLVAFIICLADHQIETRKKPD